MRQVELVRCTRCKEAKPSSEFRAHPHKRNGLQSHCKACADDIIRQGRAEGRYAERERRQRDAYAAALAALRERHRPEFEDIYDTELIKRGLA